MDPRKSVLITGGNGFIGAHLANALVRFGYDVSVIDNTSRENLNPDVRYFRDDILADEMLESIFDGIAPYIVFHLAAHTDVKYSMLNPLLDAEVNVAGTINVLNAATEVRAERIIYTSSCAVYGDTGEIPPAPETHRTRPASPYGASKLSAEHYVRLYSYTYGIKHTIFRLGNVFGPGGRGVVNAFVDRVLNGEPPIINGHGRQTRDFIYIDDVVAALLGASGEEGDNDTFNLGTGISTSVLDVYEAVRDLLAPNLLGLIPEWSGASDPIGDIDHICLDPAKYKTMFRPAPFITLRGGIQRMILERGPAVEHDV